MRHIDEQIAQASDSQEQPEAQADSQVEEVESEVNPTQAETTEQTNTETEGEDQSFFDPNQVPDELKPAYKQMQGAFTKKTQELAQERKAAEEYRQRAEAFAKYERYVPVIEEMMKNQSVQKPPEMVALEQQLREKGYSDEAVELATTVGQQLLQTTFQREQVNQIQSRIVEAANLDNRLNDNSLVYDVGDGEKATFGQIVEQLVAADANWTADPVAATQRAIKKVDALIGKAKTEGKEELSASAKGKANKFPQTNSSPQNATSTDEAMTVQEAFKQAKEELGL